MTFVYLKFQVLSADFFTHFNCLAFHIFQGFAFYSVTHLRAMTTESGSENLNLSNNVQPHNTHKVCEVESSDDCSSIVSESEHEHLIIHSKR